MGDAGEGLIDADARIQELADEREAARRERRAPKVKIDPVKNAQITSLKLGLSELRMYTAVTPLQVALTRSVRDVLYLLWGGAAFVLLIGALNIANLSLARASMRARELATRMALGAGRLRVTRQLMVEAVLLAIRVRLGAS